MQTYSRYAIALVFALIHLTWMGAPLASAQSLAVSSSSQFLMVGEQALVEYTLAGAQGPEKLNLPEIPGCVLRPLGLGGPSTTLLSGRRIGFVYQYLLTSTTPGKHVIPAVSMRVGNNEIESPRLDFEVFDETRLVWQEVTSGDKTLRYAAFFRSSKDNPFEGEILPVEIKIYFPSNQRVEDWGIPEFERQHVTAWRFEPRPQVGRVTIGDGNYFSVSYPSTMSADNSGKVSMGPAKVRLMTVQNRISAFGMEQNYEPLYLSVPKLDFQARALPEPKPSGFQNAVGQFSIETKASTTELREGDPVNLDITVVGRGNLDSLLAPRLVEPDDWKVYEPTRNPIGEQRRDANGSVVFRQLMRPLGRNRVIAPFELVFFNPETAAYETARSQPISLNVTPSTVAPASSAVTSIPAAEIPVESMTDILGLIPNPSPATQPRLFWNQGWQLFPALAVVLLLALIIQKHLLPRWARTPLVKQRLQAIATLQRAADELALLKATGHVIETHFTDLRDHPELRKLLEERDLRCFKPDATSGPISSHQRHAIMSTLKRLAFTTLVFLLCWPLHSEEAKPTDTSSAGEIDPVARYEQGAYSQAMRGWMDSAPYAMLSDVTLYHIGNAAYRMGLPGHAALYYRRALLKNPNLVEARQNLRFLERKYGAIIIQRNPFEIWLGQFSRSQLVNVVACSLWLLLIAALIFPATARDSRWRTVSWVLIGIMPIFLLSGSIALAYYPHDGEFAPTSEQAVVVIEGATLHAEATRTAAVVIQPTPGSICKVLQLSGEWAYVAMANQTRGWCLISSIDFLVPRAALSLPQIPKGRNNEGPSA